MKLGPLVRRALGPGEYWATCAYRRFFVDLRAFATELAETLKPATILDVGCGEGLSTEALCYAFRHSSIIGIDVTARVGRLFRGNGASVTFVRQELEEFASQHPGTVDLAVLCDVLHHVPEPARGQFLHNVACCLRPDGCLVVKEWEPRRNLAHLLCYLSDRYLTGDRVTYADHGVLRQLLEDGHRLLVVKESRVRPWANNIVFCAHPGAVPQCHSRT